MRSEYYIITGGFGVSPPQKFLGYSRYAAFA